MNGVKSILYITNSDECFEKENLKCRVLKKLICTNNITLAKNKYEFKVLIFSNDLEHLFLNESQKSFVSDMERRKYKIECAKKYVKRIQTMAMNIHVKNYGKRSTTI